MKEKEILFQKEYSFYPNEKLIRMKPFEEQMNEFWGQIIQSLETLRLSYNIQRKSGYGTNTPILMVTVYK